MVEVNVGSEDGDLLGWNVGREEGILVGLKDGR